jgi:hypothetical protein
MPSNPIEGSSNEAMDVAMTQLGRNIPRSVVEEACRAASINLADVEDAYPTTSFQQNIVSIAGMRGSPYVQQITIIVPESVCTERLKTAIEVVHKSWELLRTRIIHSSEGLIQVVLKDAPAFDGEWSSHLNDRNFGIGQKLTLVRLSKREQKKVESRPTLEWSLSHSLVDAWSLSRLLADIDRAYSKEPCCSPPLGLSFARYVEYLNSLDIHAANNYWKRTLVGVSVEQFPRLQNQAIRPMTNSVSKKSIPISHRSLNYTLPMIIRGAWAILVAQYTGSADVGFTVAANGRDVPFVGIESVGGPTLTTIPLCATVDYNDSIASLIDALNDQVFNAIPFGHIGLHGIQSAVAEFFIKDWAQNTLVIQSGDLYDELPSWLADFSVTVNYPQALMMESVVKQNEILLRATYDNNVISQVKLDRIIDHFGYVLTEIMKGDLVRSSIRDFCTIGHEDLATIERWNPRDHQSSNSCIHELVSQWATMNPNAIAVCAWDGELTYQQLDSLSSSLATEFYAQLLPSAKLSKQQPFIPVAVDKSRIAVIVMLAVLKTGAACVPIDCDTPRERLREILCDIGSSTVVASFEKALSLTSRDVKCFVVSSDSVMNLNEDRILEVSGLDACISHIQFWCRLGTIVAGLATVKN